MAHAESAGQKARRAGWGGRVPVGGTLVNYTGLAERTVRTCPGRLDAEGIIRPCDPDIVAARIKHADRRTKGWGLHLAQVRDDLNRAEVAALERQFPGLAASWRCRR